MPIPTDRDIDTMTVVELRANFSPEELRAYTPGRAASTGEAFDHEPNAEGITPVDTSKPFFSGETLSTAGANLWPDLKKNVRGLGSLAEQLPGAATTLGQAVGGDEEAQGKVRATGGALAESFIEPFRSKENFQRFVAEEPFSALSMAGPAVGPLSKSARLPGALQKALAVASPGRVATKAVGAARGTGRTATGLGTGMLSISTGEPTAALEAIFRAPRAKRAASSAGMGGMIPKSREGVNLAKSTGLQVGKQFDSTDMIEVVRRTAKEFKQTGTATHTAATKTAFEGAEDLVDVDGLLNQLNTELSTFGVNIRKVAHTVEAGTPDELMTVLPKSGPSFKVTLPGKAAKKTTRLETTYGGQGVKTTVGDPASRAQIDAAVKNLDELIHFEGVPQDVVSVKMVNDARQAVDAMVQAGHPQASEVARRMSEVLNKASDTLTEGKAAGARAIGSEHIKVVKELEQALSMEVPFGVPKNTAIMRAVNNALSPGNPVRRKVIANLEEATGVPLTELVAGMAMNPFIPKGLQGRATFIGGVGAAGAGGIFINPLLFLAMPAASPRIVGRTLNLLGVATAPVRKVISTLDELYALPGVQELIEQGLNVGQIIARLQEDPDYQRRMQESGKFGRFSVGGRK